MLNVMTKRILVIIGIVVVVLAVGATAAHIVSRKVPKEAKPKQPIATTPEDSIVQPKEPTITERIDTSGWRIWRNEKYGFQIKYPADPLPLGREEERIRRVRVEKPYLEKVEILMPVFAPSGTIPSEIIKEFIPEPDIQEGGVILGETFLEIGVAENSSRLPIKEWLKQYLSIGPDTSINDFSRGDLEGGVKIDWLPASAPRAGGCEGFYFPKNCLVYSIAFCQYEAWHYGNKAIFEQERRRRETILFTFEFVNKNLETR